MPVSDMSYHDEDTTFVSELNGMIEANDFLSYLENFGDKKYFLIEVTLRFSEQCQDRLKDFVPVIRKGKIAPSELSPAQRDLMEKLPEGTDPLIGFEQEYTLFRGQTPLGWPEDGYPAPQGHLGLRLFLDRFVRLLLNVGLEGGR